MRRALSITLFAVATLVAATPAAAQQPPARTSDDGQSLGLRYLTWPGRTSSARTAPERPATTPARRAVTAAAVPTPTRRPAPAIIPHGTAPDPAATGPVSASGQGLTPANAWMTPAAPARTQAVTTQPTPTPPPSMAPRPSASVSTSPAPTTAPDPMAPRRDALIFRMQGTSGATPAATPQSRPQAAPAAPASTPVAAVTAGPAEQGARYYSVHRQNNRQPDPTPLPASTYVDAIAIDMPVSLASQDLAAPPEPPSLIRNAQGRLQAMPDTSTPDQL